MRTILNSLERLCMQPPKVHVDTNDPYLSEWRSNAAGMVYFEDSKRSGPLWCRDSRITRMSLHLHVFRIANARVAKLGLVVWMEHVNATNQTVPTPSRWARPYIYSAALKPSSLIRSIDHRRYEIAPSNIIIMAPPALSAASLPWMSIFVILWVSSAQSFVYGEMPCYWPNGDVADDNFACTADGGNCCENGWACYSGLCVKEGVIERQSCSDPWWENPECEPVCNNGK